jgi:hypothetical protein
MATFEIKYAIHDGDDYWFKGFEDGEPVFVSARWRAKHFADGSEADREREALANLCQDSGMTVVGWTQTDGLKVGEAS